MKTTQENKSGLIGDIEAKVDVDCKNGFEEIEYSKEQEELSCHITVTEFDRDLCNVVLIIERFRNNIQDDNIAYYPLLCDTPGDTIDYICSMLSQEDTVVGFCRHGWCSMIDCFSSYLESIIDFYRIYAPELLRIDWYSEKTTNIILDRSIELLDSALATISKVKVEQFQLPASAFTYWMVSRLTRLLVKHDIISKVSDVDFCNYLNLESKAKFTVHNCTYFGFVLGKLESIVKFKQWFTQACFLANIQFGTAYTGRSKYKNKDQAETINGHKQILLAIDDIKKVYKKFSSIKY